MNAALVTDHPRRNPSVATWCLLGVTGGTYAASLFLPLSYEEAVQFGTAAGRPHLLGLLASLFLHVNGLHFLFNASMLWLFGRDVEEAMGSAAFFAAYLIIGVAAQLAQVGAIHLLFMSEAGVPILGASGAVSGVMGAFAGWFPRARIVFSWGDGSTAPRFGFYAAWIWGIWMTAQVGWMIWNAWGYPVRMGVWGHFAGFVMGLAAAAMSSGLRSRERQIAPEDSAAGTLSRSPRRRVRSVPASEAEALFLQAERLQSRGDVAAARQAMQQALAHALKRRAPSEAWAAYRWLADRGGKGEIPPERRLELAGLLENTGLPEEAMDVLQRLLPDAPPEVAASALLAVARIFAGPMNDPARAEEALRMIDSHYSQTRAALLTVMERQRLNSALKADN